MREAFNVSSRPPFEVTEKRFNSFILRRAKDYAISRSDATST